MALSKNEILNWIEDHVAVGETADVLENDCDIIEFMLDNCEILIPECNRFFVKVNLAEVQNSVMRKRRIVYQGMLERAGLLDGMEALAYTGAWDYSHTTAEWESVSTLGIFGLCERIGEYAAQSLDDESKKSFYRNVKRVYTAALRFMKRAADEAAAHGKHEMSASLLKLTTSAPTNLFEALQTSVIYYILQYFFDGTYLRTLGRLDTLYYSYYKKEDKLTAERMLLDYMREIDRLEAPSNIPFALGGTNANGEDLINDLSYVWLDTYARAGTTNTKLHLLCNDNTPDDIIKKAFEYVREGKNSIVFMSDKRVIDSLRSLGIEPADAANYHVVGCYECGGEGELTCSCNARVSLPKALELTLNGGKDMLTGKLIGLPNSGGYESYEALFLEFERQLAYLCKCAMTVTDLYEARYSQIHSSPFLSGSYRSSLEKGGDLYLSYAAKYNNSSVNAIGLGTVTDSLAAIRKAVYEEKIVTLDELVEILRSDWSGREWLRTFIKNKYPKYGCADAPTDAIAKRIVDVLSENVSNKPNAKGGKYRLGLFSINWRWEHGMKTAASADGRRSGETLSQNTSASFGADREGATAHLISASRLNTLTTPNGAIVDIDLHPSAVSGKNGIEVLFASLKTYFELGGFSVHYNVLDTETLLEAKKNPEKYPNLQVRLCGWNVLFSSLSEREKDEFIARSIK